MNPLQTLFRQIIVIAFALIFSFLVRKGILTLEAADALNPTILAVVDFYLPIFITSLAAVAHQLYLKFIASRLFRAARILPAGATEKEVNDEALGIGGKRAAAQVLAGIK